MRVVRDYYQKVRHPDMSDERLLGRSRIVTFVWRSLRLAIAFSVAALVPGRTVFWFAIFGWSGISATFCPTMILSLFWSRLTARGALAAMMSGFVSVPFFKFVAPQLPWVGDAICRVLRVATGVRRVGNRRHRCQSTRFAGGTNAGDIRRNCWMKVTHSPSSDDPLGVIPMNQQH